MLSYDQSSAFMGKHSLDNFICQGYTLLEVLNFFEILEYGNRSIVDNDHLYIWYIRDREIDS